MSRITRFFIGPLKQDQQRRRQRARDDFREAQEISDARNISIPDAFKVLRDFRKYGPPVIYTGGATGEYP